MDACREKLFTFIEKLSNEIILATYDDVVHACVLNHVNRYPERKAHAMTINNESYFIHKLENSSDSEVQALAEQYFLLIELSDDDFFRALAVSLEAKFNNPEIKDYDQTALLRQPIQFFRILEDIPRSIFIGMLANIQTFMDIMREKKFRYLTDSLS